MGSAARFAILSLLATAGSVPAHLERVTVPAAYPIDAGAGEVVLEVVVSPKGTVTDTAALRSTPPFTAILQSAVRGWRFAPAKTAGRPVASRVLVAGIFRPPTLRGPVAGEPPKSSGASSRGLPVPVAAVTPDYPVHAVGDGTVVVEVSLAKDGSVGEARVVGAASGFDAAATAAARGWRFKAADPKADLSGATAYLVFGFRAPVVAPGAPR
jgi:TonB family protein